MGFFDDVDSMGIVENHIKEVLKLEHSESETILSGYSGVRDRLVNRLSHLRSGSFTAQHLSGVLAQVQGAIDAINKNLNKEMLDGAEEAAITGVDHVVDEMKSFDDYFMGAVTPINLNAALLASDTANLLVTKYQTNLEAYGNDLLTQITNGLFSASLGEISSEEVIGRISQFFTAEEWKLRRIVRTELHNIYNLGKMRGMGEIADKYVPDLRKALMHPMDARTGDDSLYLARINLTAALDEPFVYRWRGERRVFMTPPDRPNDRAVMIPYREEWGNPTGDSEIPGKFPAAS